VGTHVRKPRLLEETKVEIADFDADPDYWELLENDPED
jgi:hypothetical protein